MPITPKQLESRRTRVGASDVPALFGLNPFATILPAKIAEKDQA